MSQELRGHIVIVDDDVLVREGFRDCVESGGYSVEDFGSAEEFLAERSANQSACLILDVQLPGLSGLELQLRLAEAGDRTPIVFVTAHATEEHRSQALRNGAAAFLSKPLRREELLNAVAAASTI